MNKEEALEKLKQFCEYQERCHKDVRTKLLKLKIYGDDLEEIIANLIQENYLNEERYARSYARGKFRINGWGKSKIFLGLKQKNISEYLIKMALEEIDKDEYDEILKQKIERLWDGSKLNEQYQKKISVTQKMMRKGFEYGKIVDAIEKLLDEIGLRE